VRSIEWHALSIHWLALSIERLPLAIERVALSIESVRIGLEWLAPAIEWQWSFEWYVLHRTGGPRVATRGPPGSLPTLFSR